MQVTTPDDMSINGQKTVSKCVEKIEKELASYPKNESFYRIRIWGFYSNYVSKQIEKIYSDAGWNNVTCEYFDMDKGEGLLILIINR